jgi:hypothetical protein
MAKWTLKTLPALLLAGSLALSGCSVLSDVGNESYDSAARRACDKELDSKARLDCYNKADEAARQRDASRDGNEK